MNEVLLGELIKPAKVERAEDRTFPLLSMTMHDGLVDQTSRFTKQIASADLSTYKVIHHGQLVVGFPIDEGVLDFQLIYPAGIVSPAYGVWDLVDDSRVDRRYLKGALRSPRSFTYYRTKLQGSTARRRSLPNDVFLELPIHLPSIEEQRRITAILDQADAIRTKRRQILTHLDTLTQSTFRAMFGDGGNPVVALGDLVTEGDKINYGVVQPGAETAQGVPLIRVANLVDGVVDRSNLKHIDPAVEAAYARSRIKGNEILVSCVGSIGTVSVVGPADVGSNVARAISRVPVAGEVLRTYLAAFLRSDEPQRYFRREVRAVAQPTLNVKQLAETRVPIPPEGAQREFASYMASAHAQRFVLERALAADDELFASLQSRAFRGEL